MNGTPRLRSAFPSTPRTNPRSQAFNGEPRHSQPSPQSPYNPSKGASPSVKPASNLSSLPASSRKTVIPLDIIDGPSQRLLVAGVYVALTAYRIFDCWQVTNELDSTWLFLKWLATDAAFLLILPAFQVPWLEWSFPTTLTVWLVHAVANAFLMYHIPIPIGAWLGSMVKVAYDRELSISEHRVKPADIIHNSSIILGKQIIQILPEGSAILNPDQRAYCLDEKTTSVDLPIRINQTTPILIELLRYDLDTYESETITLNSKQTKLLKRKADKGLSTSDKASTRTLQYTTSKTGLYQLQRVVDESKLEVRKWTSDTLVIVCPRASISTDSGNKCTGDLSNVSLNVTGVAPFKVSYSRRINKQQSTSNVQSIQPPDLDSPLRTDQESMTLVDPHKINLDWARPTTVTVAINESLNLNGSWSYSVEEVEDGCGNKISYKFDADDHGSKVSRSSSPEQHILVHHRPRVFLSGCDAQSFLKVAREDSVSLPARIRDPRKLSAQDWPLKLKYSFTPDTIDGNVFIEEHSFEISNERSLPKINKAGKYSIESIASQFCPGEVTEPSSCMLFNPPRPDLSLNAEDIFDKCAGNPIGLAVDLDFIGTPPFRVAWYTISHDGSAKVQSARFDGLRGQLELKPSSAGSYEYRFLEIQDDVYGSVPLGQENMTLKQDVKPPASAVFADGVSAINACLDQPVSVNVKLLGEAPWDIEYELVHGGKRKKFSARSENSIFTINTPQLSTGGHQSLVLTSVQDKSKCRTSIREERAIDVRPEQSRAAFGEIEGRRSVLALEGKSIALPLRLKGLAPWVVQISNLEVVPADVKEHTFWDANAAVSVNHSGTYEIISVRDTCPGIVDPTASTFKVEWVGRPAIAVRDPTAKSEENEIYRKSAVCVGDDAVLGLLLTGNPPFHVKYQQRFELQKGHPAISNRQISAAIGSATVQLDTTKAGEHIYTFNELSDYRYKHDGKKFRPFVVRQQVHPLPSARFSHPGTTYGYCKNDEGGTENIPLTLEGTPPFSLEMGITHHGSSKPEMVRVKDVLSNTFSWSISRRGLDLGTHRVTILKVKDSLGCENVIEHDPSAVRITVSDPPTIIPLESQSDYCVGEHVSYTLSGQPPFNIFYRFQGQERRASVPSTTFRRIAEQPGEFTITALSDNASGKCKADKNMTKTIHPMPSVKISKGRTSVVDIHEGGEAEILFEFTGTPPFEFT